MTTLADALQSPNVRKRILVEASAGGVLFQFAKTGGQTYVYENAVLPHKVHRIVEDGVDLTEKASVAEVDGDPGSWYWDAAAQKAYVHPSGSDSPDGYFFQVIYRFYFSTDGLLYNDNFYEPRVQVLPELTLRVEPRPGDVGTISTGKLGLANEDGFFNLLAALDWDAGDIEILLAADDPRYDE